MAPQAVWNRTFAMQVLSAQFDLDTYYERLDAASRRVLMIDYDGTLAPFRVRPEQAEPYPGVAELLGALVAQEDMRVVIVSGRRVHEVAGLLPATSRREIWGAHGWERMLPNGLVHSEEPAAEVGSALAEANARAMKFRQPGARIERKPASIALHWRGMPMLSAARMREKTEAAWRPLVEPGLLEWLAFDGGVELRARAANKQHAVNAVLAESGPDNAVAYLGDDVTDEDAFRAIKGRGLAVLVRPEFRETAADIWIRPPRELLEFVGRWRRKARK